MKNSTTIVHDIAVALAENFCGCCGAGIGEGYAWCSRCEHHVLASGQMHERIYLAQFGKECPFQDNPSLGSSDAKVTTTEATRTLGPPADFFAEARGDATAETVEIPAQRVEASRFEAKKQDARNMLEVLLENAEDCWWDSKAWRLLDKYVFDNICGPAREIQAEHQDQCKVNDQ